MEQILNNASCLIRTREYHTGFPRAFSHYPAGMPRDTVERLAEMAQDAMNFDRSDWRDDEGVHRRVVILEQGYLVLGISCELSNLMSQEAEAYQGFCDVAGRKCYGFFAFVWDLNHAQELPSGFPSAASFQKMIQEKLLFNTEIGGEMRSNWFVSDVSKWAITATNDGHPVDYDCQVCFERKTAFPSALLLNTTVEKVKVFSLAESGGLLDEAIWQAAQQRLSSLSLCTNMDAEEGRKTTFANITSNKQTGSPSLYPNRLSEPTVPPDSQSASAPDSPSSRSQFIFGSRAAQDPPPSYGSDRTNEGRASAPVRLQLEMWIPLTWDDGSKVWKAFSDEVAVQVQRLNKKRGLVSHSGRMQIKFHNQKSVRERVSNFVFVSDESYFSYQVEAWNFPSAKKVAEFLRWVAGGVCRGLYNMGYPIDGLTLDISGDTPYGEDEENSPRKEELFPPTPSTVDYSKLFRPGSISSSSSDSGSSPKPAAEKKKKSDPFKMDF